MEVWAGSGRPRLPFLIRSEPYLFSAGNAAGNNVVGIAVPAASVSYVRLDVSGNDVQGAPQIAEFQVYSS